MEFLNWFSKVGFVENYGLTVLTHTVTKYWVVILNAMKLWHKKILLFKPCFYWPWQLLTYRHVPLNQPAINNCTHNFFIAVSQSYVTSYTNVSNSLHIPASHCLLTTLIVSGVGGAGVGESVCKKEMFLISQILFFEI